MKDRKEIPMNIGIFTDTYYPELNGVANSAHQLKQGLEELGHKVYVFTAAVNDKESPEENVYRIASLPCPLLQEQRMTLPAVVKWCNIGKHLNLDIIHTQTEFSLGLLGRLVAKYLKIPVVHTYHTVYEDYTHYLRIPEARSGIVKAKVRDFSRYWCNRTNAIVVPTEKTKKLLEGYGVIKPIFVQPTGIDTAKFVNFDKVAVEELRRRFEIGSEDKVIIYVGRLSKEKNLEEILSYMPALLKKHGEIKLLVIGDGLERDKLKEMSGELGISDHVIFAGPVPWEEIQNYYHLGLAFVSASTSETQGLTYLEAMAAGIPVVARQDDCLNGILENSYNGFAFTGQEEFLRAIDGVIEDESFNIMGRGAERTVQRYEKGFFAKHVAEFYENVLEESHVKIENTKRHHTLKYLYGRKILRVGRHVIDWTAKSKIVQREKKYIEKLKKW